jgi:transposase-like protein
MADTIRMALAELLRKAGAEPDADLLREGVKALAEQLMEIELTERLGVDRYARGSERSGYRNGYRERRWDTRVGTIDLQVPRARDGGFVPALLEPRKRAERALVAVVQEAYVEGLSTRRVDDLVRALGMAGISKSQVSRLCQELDGLVERFRTRPLQGPYPYLWLDALFLKVRQDGKVTRQAVVVATAVRATGEREIVGFDVGPSEDGAFWLQFLRGLVTRGLGGVQLVTSDAHVGLTNAIAAVLHGAVWQRCRIHFVRNLVALVPKNAEQTVAAMIRTVFVQPDPSAAREQWHKVIESFRARFPRVAELMDAAEQDVLAYLGFPSEHWRQIWSTNPLERLNREIKRRTDVVGIFPQPEAVTRLVGAILAEQNDEWEVARRYFSAESLAKLFAPPEEVIPLPLPAVS